MPAVPLWSQRHTSMCVTHLWLPCLLACRAEIDEMIERRVRDFRLDTRLKNACEKTILDQCSYMGDVTVMDTYDTEVVKCLQVTTYLPRYLGTTMYATKSCSSAVRCSRIRPLLGTG